MGTGLGPTLEFYSLVSKEFARRDLKIWRDADQTRLGQYVHHPDGLFPAPISPDDIANDGGQYVNLFSLQLDTNDIDQETYTHLPRHRPVLGKSNAGFSDY